MLTTLARTWGLRHLRWRWQARRLYRAARVWGELGMGSGLPTEADLRALDAIWEGEA